MITETIGSITIVLPETEGLFSPRGRCLSCTRRSRSGARDNRRNL